jgi:hypothetical protein
MLQSRSSVEAAMRRCVRFIRWYDELRSLHSRLEIPEGDTKVDLKKRYLLDGVAKLHHIVYIVHIVSNSLRTLTSSLIEIMINRVLLFCMSWNVTSLSSNLKRFTSDAVEVYFRVVQGCHTSGNFITDAQYSDETTSVWIGVLQDGWVEEENSLRCPDDTNRQFSSKELRLLHLKRCRLLLSSHNKATKMYCLDDGKNSKFERVWFCVLAIGSRSPPDEFHQITHEIYTLDDSSWKKYGQC